MILKRGKRKYESDKIYTQIAEILNGARISKLTPINSDLEGAETLSRKRVMVMKHQQRRTELVQDPF